MVNVGDCISDNDDGAQEQLVMLIRDTGAKDIFNRVTVPHFWCSMLESYPSVAMIAQKTLMPVPSTYLCEAAFSTMLAMKNKQRNRLDIQADMRCCLLNTTPRIS